MEENNTQITNEEQSVSSLTITQNASTYLNETGKWTKFLSIMGFIFVGLIVIMGFLAGSIMSIMPGGQSGVFPAGMGFLFGGIYILLGLLYFFPTWYLFKFSQKMKLALTTNSNDELNEALSNQKSFYKFWGIFTIVFIGLYVLIGLFALLAKVLM